MGDKTRGIYHKFNIERTDGKSKPGEKHFGCEYWVLDLTHDPYALWALEAYASACQREYPLLYVDLQRRIAELKHAHPMGV
jgi:hypothetical protein